MELDAVGALSTCWWGGACFSLPMLTLEAQCSSEKWLTTTYGVLRAGRVLVMWYVGFSTFRPCLSVEA